MSWETKYNRLRAGLRGLLLDLRVATAGVEPHKDPLGVGIHVVVQRLEKLLPDEEVPCHVNPEKAEQLELPLVPWSVSEVQGL